MSLIPLRLFVFVCHFSFCLRYCSIVYSRSQAFFILLLFQRIYGKNTFVFADTLTQLFDGGQYIYKYFFHIVMIVSLDQNEEKKSVAKRWNQEQERKNSLSKLNANMQKSRHQNERRYVPICLLCRSWEHGPLSCRHAIYVACNSAESKCGEIPSLSPI